MWLPRVTEVIVTRHTRNVYTSNKKSDDFSGLAKSPSLVPVVFQGDSRRVLQGFPDGVQGDLGYALYRLQLGQTPPDRKLVREVGAGAYELREQDQKAWYRGVWPSCNRYKAYPRSPCTPSGKP